MVIPEKTNNIKPMIAPATDLREFSGLDIQRGITAELRKFPETEPSVQGDQGG